MDTLKNLLIKTTTFLLLLFSGSAMGQVAVNSVTADTPVSFASTDFEMGMTITINLSSGVSSADVEVALKTGAGILTSYPVNN